MHLQPNYLCQFRGPFREPRACLVVRHSLAHRLRPSFHHLEDQSPRRLNQLYGYLPLGHPIEPVSQNHPLYRCSPLIVPFQTEIWDWNVDIAHIPIPSFIPLIPVKSPLQVPSFSPRVFPIATQEDLITELRSKMNQLYHSRAQLIAIETSLYASVHFDTFQTPVSDHNQQLFNTVSTTHRDLQQINDFEFVKGVGRDASKYSLAKQVQRIPPQILIHHPQIISYFQAKGHPLEFQVV